MFPDSTALRRHLQRDRGAKVRHSFCRNNSGSAETHGFGPSKPNMAKGCFVDRVTGDAAFVLEKITVIVNSFSEKELQRTLATTDAPSSEPRAS